MAEQAARANERDAVEAAERAFSDWSATPAAQRGRLLERASELLLERQAEVAALVTEETRATVGWGALNVQLAARMLAYYGGQADAAGDGEEIPSHIPGRRAKAVRQPVGVVVGIAPWNAPVILGVRAVAAPLAYGNTVVLKASEVCPRTHAAIVDVLKDSGVPAGAINLVTHDSEDAAAVADELIAHPAVRRISFTGSTRVGRVVAEKAARHLKRVLLELGGKAPLIVLPDARKLGTLTRSGCRGVSRRPMSKWSGGTRLRVRGTSVLFESASRWPAGGSLFGQVRELYGRDVYFAGPGFSVTPGDVVVDLGANAGIFAVLAAKLGGSVVAVEALPPLRLARNLQANGCADRVLVVHGLLGARIGLLHERPDTALVGPGVEGRRSLGPSVTMQDLVETHRLDRIDFLKVDIEGTEFELLRRDELWLGRVRRIAADVHLEFGRAEELQDELEAAGFATALDPSSGSSSEITCAYLYAWRA